ncbi:ROK family protein [Agromyces sp. G08B096]|uniref:ROK family protein n=1 Tax=Agromyces sp. G08B096 TaxID=3156399 RepID=A0AAU7W7Z4_9MICO
MEPYVLAVDLGGTKVEAALVSTDGLRPGSRARAATGRHAGPADLERAVRHVVRSALASAPAGTRPSAAGIGSAGPVDARAGSVSPINLPASAGFPLRSVVADAAGLALEEVELQLDGQCIALAEYRRGALRPYRYALGMVVSTGVGGGLVLDGRLVGGASGNAGHVGQLLIGDGGGDVTTVEEIASGTSIVAWARSAGWTGDDGADLAASYAAGHPVAVAAVERCGTAIGRAVLSAAALVDLQGVAIGGGFAKVTPDLFAVVERTIRRESPLRSIEVAVHPAQLGDDAPLLGAACLVLAA